jgi:hypothetical protein
MVFGSSPQSWITSNWWAPLPVTGRFVPDLPEARMAGAVVMDAQKARRVVIVDIPVRYLFVCLL